MSGLVSWLFARGMLNDRAIIEDVAFAMGGLGGNDGGDIDAVSHDLAGFGGSGGSRSDGSRNISILHSKVYKHNLSTCSNLFSDKYWKSKIFSYNDLDKNENE